MTHKEQTAVDWLVEQLRNNENIRWRGTRLIELEEQAKEMEKEQIEQAATWGSLFETGKQYYKETYKGNK